jgi:dTDP-4-dehydrorhamnose 3,5-epimerase
MKFRETPLKGAYLVGIEPVQDERGFFARSWCCNEFAARGLNARLVQCNITLTRHKGTLRGMHYQTAPHEEAKLVRCTRGSIHDVIIDLRSDSPTFRHWFATELTADNYTLLYVPEGFAHGFLTLADNSEVFYQMSEFYRPECAAGVRWNDPAFNIEWPGTVRIISQKDRGFPDFVA